MKVGVPAWPLIGWDGGVDFLHTVCGSLAAADHPVELHLLVPTRGTRLAVHRLNLRLRRMAKRLQGRSTAHLQPPDLDRLPDFIKNAGTSIRLHEIDSGSAAIRRAFRQLQLDIVLPSLNPLEPADDVPWIGYLTDLQHKHLPHFFPPPESAKRDLAMTRMLREARTVIVNSRNVIADIHTYFPAASADVVALPFSAAPLPAWFELNPNVARSKYSVGPKYFIICNQFWKHKDHGTAFKAFAALARIHPELRLVCTGSTSDYRDPHYFSSLQHLLRELGIEDRVAILGRIPKPDQLALMRGAVALIQPTMFEGGPGGGAVYDGVALGVSCIVSDIPVNLEIDEPDVHFFKSRDSASLREVMSLIYGEFDIRVPPSAADLLAKGRARRKACGNVLVKAAMKVIEQASARSE